MKYFKRCIAFFLAVCMLTGLMAFAVSAEDTIIDDNSEIVETVETAEAAEIETEIETEAEAEETVDMILADDPDTDKFGDNLTWTLEGGTLTISGSGAMYGGETYVFPWENDKNSITSIVLGDGVTSIGENAFSGCSALVSVTIPASVNVIGASAFSGCSSLSTVDYSGTAQEWINDITINSGNDALTGAKISHTGDHVMEVVDGQCQHHCVLCKVDETVTGGFYDECGEPAGGQEGWVEKDGSKYYYVDSVPVTGWYKIDGVWYYFSGTGVMQTGWVKPGAAWYYLNENGQMLTGWLKINGKWYYLNPSGAMATGWKQVNDKWYYLYPSGAMATGWLKDNGKWYYLSSSGAMVTGWLKINGKWYYFSSSGKMQVNWTYVDGEWYFMYDSGAMATGWIQPNGSRWYYMTGSGAMATGWMELDGNKYYFESDGHMVIYWHQIGGNWYYFTGSGALQYDKLSMTAKAQLYSSATNYLILVDCKANMMGIFRGSKNNWTLMHEWSCATGAGSTKTPKGVYQIQYQIYSFSGPDTVSPLTFSNPLCYTVYWASNFASGGYFIHSTLYRYESWVVMDDRLGMDLSHGCIRLATDNAKWLWYNIPVGTTVVTY